MKIKITFVVSSLLLINGCLPLEDDTTKETTNTSLLTESQNMISRQNEIRAEVFLGAPVVWSDVIALSAQAHADYLAQNNLFEHSANSPYGENLYASSATATYTDAVNSWYEEKVNYDLVNKTCAVGAGCGHYTQLIWKDSIEVGCAKSSSASWNSLIVCQYSPAGNMWGVTPF